CGSRCRRALHHSLLTVSSPSVAAAWPFPCSFAWPFAPTATLARSPFRTACTAPGVPYSYGPPTTCGISSKLKIGGGEETCHSSVSARQGFPPAGGPNRQLQIML